MLAPGAHLRSTTFNKLKSSSTPILCLSANAANQKKKKKSTFRSPGLIQAKHSRVVLRKEDKPLGKLGQCLKYPISISGRETDNGGLSQQGWMELPNTKTWFCYFTPIFMAICFIKPQSFFPVSDFVKTHIKSVTNDFLFYSVQYIFMLFYISPLFSSICILS